MRALTLCVAILLASAVVVAGFPGATLAQDASGYSGTHLQFGAQDTRLTDYRVDDTTFFDSIAVESEQRAREEGALTVGAGVSAVTALTGSSLEVTAQTETTTAFTAESGATIETHDNPHGIAVVESGSQTQYVSLNVSDGVEARYTGDATATVETDSGAVATVFVVGEGTVGVNEDGAVVARLEPDGYLVVRTYNGPRGTDDATREQFVADGVATAEVFVVRQDGERVVDTIAYGNTTTVESTLRGDGLDISVERATTDGTVVLTSLPVGLVGDDVSVAVDGENASMALTYSELPLAANGGQTAKYLVHERSGARPSTDVAVAVTNFSASSRTISIRSASAVESTAGETGDDGESTESSEESGSSEASSPGFGVLSALLALVAAVALGAMVRRR